MVLSYFLKSETIPALLLYPGKMPPMVLFDDVYHKYRTGEREFNNKGMLNVGSVSAIYNKIILLFDTTNDNIQKKKDINNLLKSLWIKRTQETDYGWIDISNITQTEWLLDYMEKSKVYPWFLPNSINNTFKYHSCIAALDVLDPRDIPSSNQSKHQFISKMKRAWSQKKYRQKNADKKPFSFEMHESISEKIDKLSYHHNIKKNVLIEKLINSAYDELING